ncbi:TetR family transcriptional regulator [Wenjunlia vitaminophila]|uniref:TetR family transcriptional regulator n=1 Tax=Wenjunlia vitaminophila TaxID=76728 RepID=A0A0T6LM43_WENVI|nr:TetR family transcriptional regulator [Wenjunlia vitaminophila]KRV46993.1 TetR family transcriptional regulator [Wenjunlia vitaminophila]
MTAPTPSRTGSGLRERKKTRTRLAIRREAYRLFQEQGFEATTVEQVCAAAEVSLSTFFRYFPSKEDVVLTAEYDVLIKDALRARPPDEPVIESVRTVTRALFGAYLERYDTEARVRTRLFREVPALRFRMAQCLEESLAMLREIMAERTGLPETSLEVRVVCGALLAAVNEACFGWPEDGTSTQLLDDIDRALDVLARGLAP